MLAEGGGEELSLMRTRVSLGDAHLPETPERRWGWGVGGGKMGPGGEMGLIICKFKNSDPDPNSLWIRFFLLKGC